MRANDEDNVWLWSLGGPALIAIAVLSAVLFAHNLDSRMDADQAEARPVGPELAYTATP